MVNKFWLNKDLLVKKVFWSLLSRLSLLSLLSLLLLLLSLLSLLSLLLLLSLTYVTNNTTIIVKYQMSLLYSSKGNFSQRSYDRHSDRQLDFKSCSGQLKIVSSFCRNDLFGGVLNIYSKQYIGKDTLAPPYLCRFTTARTVTVWTRTTGESSPSGTECLALSR